MRTAIIGDLRLVASVIPASAMLVRIHPDDGPLYDRLIVAWQKGDTVHLMGWIGEPLSAAEWRAARDAFFPEARLVAFERMTAGGELRAVKLRID